MLGSIENMFFSSVLDLETPQNLLVNASALKIKDYVKATGWPQQVGAL
jgi:hypothetical protein